MSRDEDHYLPLPVGWVEYVEKPLTDQQRIVRCPLGAAPAWVQRKHSTMKEAGDGPE